MKQTIRKFLFSDDDKGLVDVWPFVKQGESYHRLDDDGEVPVGSVLSNNHVIYLVEERFFSAHDMQPVYYKGEEIARVGWKVVSHIQSWGKSSCNSSTALSFKLRIQEQLGFPVYSIDVKFRGKSMQNNERIIHEDVDLKTELRTEVA